MYANYNYGTIAANGLTNGAYQIIAYRQDGGVPPGTSTARLYKNNQFLNSGSVDIPTNILRDNNFIGYDSWGDGDYNGEIAEIIIFNFTMGRAQNYIIENYLSTKYGIPLASNDYYDHDATHSYDVAGG